MAPLAPSITFAGFSRWMSPELLDIEPDTEEVISLSQSSDIWAVACTILEAGDMNQMTLMKLIIINVYNQVFTGGLPFSRYNHDIRIQKAILSGELPGAFDDLPHNSSRSESLSKLWKILKSCWSMPPSERPDILAVRSKAESAISPSPVSVETVEESPSRGNIVKPLRVRGLTR